MIFKAIDNRTARTLTNFHFVNTVISKIAYGAKIVWQLITSCFASGIWREQSNWVDLENWKETE